jgi:hypothetical protein
VVEWFNIHVQAEQLALPSRKCLTSAVPVEARASSKFCTKRPNVIPRIGKASIIPGQLLLPTPKGRYLKSLPLASTLASSSKILSGLNSSGFFQWAGLLASRQLSIHDNLALRRNVISAKLIITEVHVWD